VDTWIVALEQANFPIVANKPVLVTVTLVIVADASNDAAVEVDFASAPGLEMDTSFVALMVNS